MKEIMENKPAELTEKKNWVKPEFDLIGKDMIEGGVNAYNLEDVVYHPASS